MSSIKRPEKVYFNKENKTSRLYFQAEPGEEGGANKPASQGEYYMRGGVCWPVLVGHQVRGYAILAGMDIETKKTYIFEEKAFSCIDHIIGESGGIEVEGASSWFNMCWTSYFADTFYYHNYGETHKKYMLQVLRSSMIKPKPCFIDAPWQDEDQALQAIYERTQQNKLFYKENGALIASLRSMNVKPDKLPPEIIALMCCISGMERYPFRKKEIVI